MSVKLTLTCFRTLSETNDLTYTHTHMKRTEKYNVTLGESRGKEEGERRDRASH